MRTELSSFNPFGYTRHGYALEALMKRSRESAHLDIGCFDGAWLREFCRVSRRDGFGIDVNAEALDRGRGVCPAVRLQQADLDAELPFPSASFGSVTLLDVIEHLDFDDQQVLLDEIRRVLSPGGVFVVTVPREHKFSWLDTGNFKFRAPRLHRAMYSLKNGRAAYNYRYVNNPFGLVGDVSAKKRWHEHFSEARLTNLLVERGFRVCDVDGAGKWSRLLAPLRVLVPLTRWRRMMAKVEERDNRRHEQVHLFITAVRD